MNAQLVLRPVAQAEFDEAAVRYENQREGLGLEFVEEVEKVLGIIARDPDRFAVVSGDVREALVRRFPYAIYYRIKPKRTVILAVFHCSRGPEIWQGRD